APQPPETKTGKKVAIIGSGPAGMAAAQQLARAGHDVHVFEKNACPGGLMRYGIPDFKMEKHVIERRAAQMEAEGVTFHCNVHVGVDRPIGEIEKDHDAVLLACGSEKPRDLPVPGRELAGVHFAMDFLPQQNRRVSGEPISTQGTDELAKDRNVVVIGGGDTGSDCIGTSFRHGAKSVTQIEIMPAPPEREDKEMTWPHWPMKMRTSSSQAEGANRDFAVMTKRFEGDGNGRVAKLVCCRVDSKMQEVEGSEFEIDAELVLLAMGFTNPVHEGLVEDLGLELDGRGNVKADDRAYETSKRRVFTAGDMRRGQSLVVWAIREGRQAAHAIDKTLMGKTDLPR
ncbi:MAG: glutamate synthase subunit beta, partial [Pseudomonadota bacterium]